MEGRQRWWLWRGTHHGLPGSSGTPGVPGTADGSGACLGMKITCGHGGDASLAASAYNSKPIAFSERIYL